MRCPTVVLVLAAAALQAGPGAAQTREAPACPTPEQVQMTLQAAPGASLPDRCRMITVQRLDTPAGPLCRIDLGGQDGGVLSGVRDAVLTTTWWIACDSLRAP